MAGWSSASAWLGLDLCLCCVFLSSQVPNPHHLHCCLFLPPPQKLDLDPSQLNLTTLTWQCPHLITSYHGDTNMHFCVVWVLIHMAVFRVRTSTVTEQYCFFEKKLHRCNGDESTVSSVVNTFGLVTSSQYNCLFPCSQPWSPLAYPTSQNFCGTEQWICIDARMSNKISMGEGGFKTNAMRERRANNDQTNK